MNAFLRLSLFGILLSVAFYCSAQQVPVLDNPANNSTDINVKMYLRCNMLSGGGLKYQFMYDTSSSFDSPLLVNRIENSWLIYPNAMRFNANYYWKVRSIHNNTDTSLWSTTWKFKTLDSFEVTGPIPNTTDVTIDINLYFKSTGGLVRLQYDTTADFSSPILADTSFVDSLLASIPRLKLSRLYFGRNYYVRGMAYTYTDTLPFSKAFKFSTIPYPKSNTAAGTYDVTVNPYAGSVSSSSDDTTLRYDVQMDTSLSYNSPLFVEDIRASSYTPTPPFILYYGKNYFLRFRAWHAKDTSAWSTPINITTKSGPTTFASPASSDTLIRPDSARFMVFNMQGVSRYEIMADTSSLFSSPVLINDTLNQNGDGALRNLFFNKMYYIKVRTITSIDTSAWLYKNIRTMPYPFLLTPQNNNAFTLTNPELSWTALGHITGYTLMLDTSNTFSSPLLMVIDSTKKASKITTSDLRYDQAYYWKLQARTAKDTSLWTQVFQFKTSPFVIYINSPYNGEQNVAVNPTYISWSQPTGIRGFHYQISKDSLYTNPINKYINDREKYSDNLNGLEYSTRYFLRLRGFNNVDTTDWYYENIFTTVAEPPTPVAPVLKLPVNGATKQPYSGLTLSWNAVSNATSYEIQTDISSSFNNPISGTSNTTQITITSMQPSTQYYWRVRGLNGTRAGAWSNPFSFTTFVLLVPPTQLTPDNFTLVSPTQVTLQWEANADANHYEYQYANEPSFSGATTYPTIPNQATLTNLTSGFTYYWRVRTIILPYASAWSETAIFRAGTVGIDDVIFEQAQWFFPNPSTGEITIQKDAQELIKKLSIYTTSGIKIMETDNVHSTLNLTNIPKGMYIVHIQLHDGLAYSKLIIE
jgi:hypothetical protein